MLIIIQVALILFGILSIISFSLTLLYSGFYKDRPYKIMAHVVDGNPKYYYITQQRRKLFKTQLTEKYYEVFGLTNFIIPITYPVRFKSQEKAEKFISRKFHVTKIQEEVIYESETKDKI